MLEKRGKATLWPVSERFLPSNINLVLFSRVLAPKCCLRRGLRVWPTATPTRAAICIAEIARFERAAVCSQLARKRAAICSQRKNTLQLAIYCPVRVGSGSFVRPLYKTPKYHAKHCRSTKTWEEQSFLGSVRVRG